MAGELSFSGVHLAGKPVGTLWDINCKGGNIGSITEHDIQDAFHDGRFLSPSLCHPHIHLDKCFLLSHPKYSDLVVENGSFAEAMELTSKAKARFEHDDILERGRALIEESIGYGVTHMRAFVEVDQIVGTKCLDVGLILKDEFKQRCYVQLCAFAQDPIYSQDDGGEKMQNLLQNAAARKGVDAIGSTPYVEKTLENQYANVEWMTRLAQTHFIHLDFHLDYNLNATTEPLVYLVIQKLQKANWTNMKVVTLGHCTRLTLFSAAEWEELHLRIGKFPIFFVGLPTSDVFMMGRPDDQSGGGERVRGTLQIPQMIRRYGIQAALGVNNVGNAFTPHGSCDPLSVACLGVGIYQAGSKQDAEILLECVSSRARAAIGLGRKTDIRLGEGDTADLVAFGKADRYREKGFRHRRTSTDLVYDPCHERVTVFGGEVVSR